MMLLFLILMFLRSVRLQEYSEQEILDKAANDMKFAIYTRKNPEQSSLFNLNDDLLKNTYFDKDKIVKVLIHGWQGNFLDDFSMVLKNEYLIQYDANVIIVDYSKDARPIWYFSARDKVPLISAVVAKMMDDLIFKFGADSHQIHAVGYSLGGQVAGVAGLKLTAKNRISKYSAIFVDVIHCDSRLGYGEPIGHADFFPNGPIKSLFDDITHFKSFRYFGESINSPGGFMATSCPTWTAFKRDECPLDAQITEMGEHVSIQQNPNEFMKFNISNDSLKKTYFDKDKPVKIIIHGWLGSYLDSSPTLLKNAYLVRYDANIIVVDYSKDAASYWYYSTSNRVPIISAAIAYLIDKMVFVYRVKSDQIHLIGYSLGGQVVGVTGLRTKKKIGRATGLDPPSFGFHLSKKERLRRESAKFVDVIHTYCRIGFTVPIGHIDFFPNGGDFQPEKVAFESHYKAFGYFLESVDNPGGFIAISCPSWDVFKKEECPLDAQIVEMGEYVSTSAQGSFYLTTNAEWPFAKGEASLIYDG